MKKIKWGLLGYGKFAKKIEQSFLETEFAELKAIASKSFDNEDNYLNTKIFYNSYDDLINNEEIENIYIATTNNLHKDLIIKSANNKKNILCEKPACLKEKDFIECINTLRKNNIFFMEGLMYLHHPQIEKTISIIKNGEIGNIEKINADFGYKIGRKFLFFELKKIDQNSRIFNPLLGGGAIYDLGCYPLTAVLLFFRIGKKNNNIKNYKFDSDIGRYGVDENAKANLIFECGGKAEINVSIRKNLQNIIEIFGTKGKIKILNPWISQRNSKIELEIKGKKMLIESFLKKDIYALELDKASIAIINNKKEIDFPGATLRSSLEYIKIIDKWKS